MCGGRDPQDFAHLRLNTEIKLGALDSIDFGAKRSITTGEVALWAHFSGARFAAHACASASLEEVPAARFD